MCNSNMFKDVPSFLCKIWCAQFYSVREIVHLCIYVEHWDQMSGSTCAHSCEAFIEILNWVQVCHSAGNKSGQVCSRHILVILHVNWNPVPICRVTVSFGRMMVDGLFKVRWYAKEAESVQACCAHVVFPVSEWSPNAQHMPWQAQNLDWLGCIENASTTS